MAEAEIVRLLRGKVHVLIESGIVTGGDTPELIGRRCYMVSLVESDGTHLHDYIGESYVAAGEAAIGWARDYGCKIVDRSSDPSDLEEAP